MVIRRDSLPDFGMLRDSYRVRQIADAQDQLGTDIGIDDSEIVNETEDREGAPCTTAHPQPSNQSGHSSVGPSCNSITTVRRKPSSKIITIMILGFAPDRAPFVDKQT
ncbi:hypothetical protein EVAR_65442_1 [Eumeta japonica]|uniref:Uncharacterized protein n=1 Tax=Eumeta variegata TaxID=151549 RepID=A0A4C1ZBC1_EUMVA|nr:hypothetical protein EVAR_65442_1 [Eumeta japonica]